MEFYEENVFVGFVVLCTGAFLNQSEKTFLPKKVSEITKEPQHVGISLSH